MSNQEPPRGYFEKPAEPLINLFKSLGLPADKLSIDSALYGEEEAEEFKYVKNDMLASSAGNLTWEQIEWLVDRYGDAISCQFLLGTSPKFEIKQGEDKESLKNALEEFLQWVKSQSSKPQTQLIIDISLDKKKLVERWCKEVPHPYCSIFLYLFPKSFHVLLNKGWKDLENAFWKEAGENTYKVLVLLPDYEIWLNGQYLAILGGEKLNNDWQMAIPHQPPNGEPIELMYSTCRQHINWYTDLLKRLTPRHLIVDVRKVDEGEVGGRDEAKSIHNLLKMHQAKLSILYTAEQTTTQGSKIVAIYRDTQQSAEVTLDTAQTTLDERELAGVTSLLQIVEWAYTKDTSSIGSSLANRLPLVQTNVVRMLSGVDKSEGYKALIRRAPGIYGNLLLHWEAIVNDTINKYLTQEKLLEDTVSSTIRAYSEQTSGIIKGLSDTMLASIAALLTAIIAALFKGDFNQGIFRIGIGVYAVYLLIFPCLINMSSQFHRFNILGDDFQDRRNKYESMLTKDKVKEIISDRNHQDKVERAKTRFRRWFWLSVALYLGVFIVLLLVALYGLPGEWVARVASTVTPTPTLMPVETPIR